MPHFDVPTPTNPVRISVDAGASLVLLGANGAGKTRLGVMIEQALGANSEVHRIGAHRSLVMNTRVQPPSYEIAERRLFYGSDQGAHGHRVGHRWQSHPATALLSDFDHVLSALYADENRTSVLHRQAHLLNQNAKPPQTKLDRLKTIWHSLLPNRQLLVLDGNIQVKPIGNVEAQYDAAELSDGERVIFYLIGQTLLTRGNSLVIVDEPELHVNRSILAKLWDAIESARKDCAFIYLTHDIEFTISRRAATKYSVNSYLKGQQGEKWEIEPIPDDTGLSEEVITKIAGSRLPLLFIEGDGGSLDSALYRRVYDSFTTIPVGPCDHVIHSVASFTQHGAFHRLKSAGLIDADGRDNDEVKRLASMNVHVLSVSEVENVLLLPKPFLALAKLLQFDAAAAEKKLADLISHVMKTAQSDMERYATDATRRHIDIAMKAVGLSSKSIAELSKEFEKQIAKIDPAAIYTDIQKDFESAIGAKDYPKALRLYDNKGLLAEAAKILGMKGRKELEEFIGRALQNDSGSEFLAALKAELPTIKV
jgi:energy-coupling factor transporter ATP-binding protein EcfA2